MTGPRGWLGRWGEDHDPTFWICFEGGAGPHVIKIKNHDDSGSRLSFHLSEMPKHDAGFHGGRTWDLRKDLPQYDGPGFLKSLPVQTGVSPQVSHFILGPESLANCTEATRSSLPDP